MLSRTSLVALSNLDSFVYRSTQVGRQGVCTVVISHTTGIETRLRERERERDLERVGTLN